MAQFKLNTPVLFLIFNRPETTKQVFEEIRKAKPKELFIACDGPRKNKIGEKEKVEEVRDIVSKIDWPCKVKKLYRKKNLGCKYAVSSAIDWFFENVEEGIILEDDCLPSQSFFRFCQEMLDKYKNDEKIMHVSGTNVEGISKIEKDYFFSKCYNVWGWATWRRAWKKYDVEMKEWKNIRFSKKFLNIIEGYSFPNKIKSWRLYQLTYLKKIDTWDYQWDLICKLSGLSIIPSKNFITNIGFSSDATHTSENGNRKNLSRFEMGFPLTYNNKTIASKKYNQVYSSFFRTEIFTKIKSLIFE